MLRAVVFLGLIISAFAAAALDVLVNAAASFSATIQQQLEMLQSNPSTAELAEKTIDYAEAKEAYFKALRAEVPELLKIATGRQARPPGAGHLRRGVRSGGRKTGDGCGPRDAGIAKTLLAKSRRREGEGGIRACSKSRRDIP
jgi:hypothetical protein